MNQEQKFFVCRKQKLYVKRGRQSLTKVENHWIRDYVRGEVRLPEGYIRIGSKIG